MNKTTKLFLGLGIILGVILVIIFSRPSYHIYKVDCKLTSLNDTCNDKIEIENMSMQGFTFLKEQLDEETLNNLCNKLNENSWGCGIYLVIYE